MLINNKKCLVIILDSFARGGAENVVKILIPEFSQAFKSVHLVLLQNVPNEYLLKDLEILGLNLHRLNAKKILHMSVLLKFIVLLRKIKPDVIHAHLFWSQIISTSSFLTLRKVKIIWIEHDTILNRTRLHWIIYRLLSFFTSQIIAVSLEVKDYLRSKGITKTQVIHNPILELFSLRNDYRVRPNFLFIGRLVTQKNPKLLIEAFHFALRNKMIPSNSTLQIVGVGRLETKLRKMIGDLKINGSVSIYGFYDSKELLKIYQSNCVLVSTSIHEGFGLTRIEALATGSCIVTTKTGGISTLVDANKGKELKKIGIFIVNNDVVSVANALEEALKSRYWNINLITKRSQLTTEFKPQIIAKKYIEL